MLKQIIRKEILDHLMSMRFALTCVLCFIVIMCSLFVRHQDYAQTLSAYHEKAAMAKTFLKTRDHPWWLVWRGAPVHHPPTPLKIFVRGVEDGNGYSVDLNSNEPPSMAATEIENPFLPLFPSMDLVTFVGVIMSLLAIVFGYDAICGEKERGTLRLMLSYRVPRDTVLLGKWIGGYVTLIIPFLLAVIAGSAIVVVRPDISLTAVQWGQFAAVCFLALLYIAAVFSVAVWVSTITPRSSTSIMILVTLWMVFVLAIPNLSPYLAQTWRPTSNMKDVEETRRTTAETMWEETVKKPMKKYDKAHGFEPRWWMEVDWRTWNEGRKRGVERRLYELDLERKGLLARQRASAQIDEKLISELDQQISLSRWISRFSPFSCFAMAATELTDTGIHNKRRFLSQLRDHQKTLCSYALDEWIALEQHELDNQGKRLNWKKTRKKKVPVFAYAPAAGSEYMKLILVDTGILAGMAIVFFLLSYIGFLRYDVR